jgi:hypothetical protein
MGLCCANLWQSYFNWSRYFDRSRAMTRTVNTEAALRPTWVDAKANIRRPVGKVGYMSRAALNTFPGARLG